MTCHLVHPGEYKARYTSLVVHDFNPRAACLYELFQTLRRTTRPELELEACTQSVIMQSTYKHARATWLFVYYTSLLHCVDG